MMEIEGWKGVTIKVVGVGGAGSNAVDRMIQIGIPGVDFVAVNTDAQALARSEATHKIQLGVELTRSLGAGGDPVIGARAAYESREELGEVLRGADMVFIAAGMGGGTGTGAAPIVAQIAQAGGALTIAVVCFPYPVERLSPARGGPLLVVDREGRTLRSIPAPDGRPGRDRWVTLDMTDAFDRIARGLAPDNGFLLTVRDEYGSLVEFVPENSREISKRPRFTLKWFRAGVAGFKPVFDPDHAADADGPLRRASTHPAQQDPRGGARAARGAGALQARHPRAVPEPGLLRPRGLRHRGRGADLLRQAGGEPQRGRGDAAHGARAWADALRPVAAPAPRSRAA